MSYSVPWSCDKEDGTARWLALALFRVAWTRLMGQPRSTGHASLALQTRPSDDGLVSTPKHVMRAAVTGRLTPTL